jgi:hypothetical protein
MDYKFVSISDSVSVRVPVGLSPDDEAMYIAKQIGFVDFDALENQFKQALKDQEEGKLVELQTVLDEIERDWKAKDGTKS